MQLYQDIIKQLTLWQYDLNRYISTTIRSIDDENNLTSSFLVLGIAFLYGLIHAAGPGHGKALVSFYFISNKSDYKKAFKMGYMISIIHAISALMVTFSIYFIIHTMFRKNFNDFSQIAMSASAIMIIIVGLFIVYEGYKAKKLQISNDDIKDEVKSKSEYAVAFGAGIVPCPGVMTIVLFCIVLKKFILGIFAAIFMSIGMGLTISLAGVLSLAISKKSSFSIGKYGYLLQMLSGILIVILGIFLLQVFFR
jgi:ABC-type nickel/cobalt efflux system permease component RcnA